MASLDTDEDFLFLAEDDPAGSAIEQTLGEWHLLIVDDDEEIHTVTKLALNDLVVMGRQLVFHHAYSGKTAIEFCV